MKRSISMDTIATFDGSISDSNGSLQLPDVSNLMDYRPLLGNEEVRPVTCTAAASKPPEEVKWLTGTLAGPSSETEGLRVIGGDKSVVEKGTVVLPCIIMDNKESMSQILWRRVTRGKPLIDDFFTILDTNEAKYLNGHDLRFQFIGDINKDNGSLQLSNAKLEDEGTYICVVTVFPSGNYQADITLNLLVPPVSSLKGNPLLLGNEEVLLVTCTAAASKPPAEVKWLTGTLAGLKETTNTTTHGNGTTTTVSSLFGVPNMQIYQQEVKCVITSAAPSGSKTLIYSIQIH
ncbi:Poliovirus receptor, partial [Nibea albiflora]